MPWQYLQHWQLAGTEGTCGYSQRYFDRTLQQWWLSWNCHQGEWSLQPIWRLMCLQCPWRIRYLLFWVLVHRWCHLLSLRLHFRVVWVRLRVDTCRLVKIVRVLLVHWWFIWIFIDFRRYLEWVFILIWLLLRRSHRHLCWWALWRCLLLIFWIICLTWRSRSSYRCLGLAFRSMTGLCWHL